jgi:hypothetical protein
MKMTKPSFPRPALRGWVLALAVAGAIFAASGTSRAQTQVYFQDFDADSTANWVVNITGDPATSYSYANFFFDYSTVGVASAPNSVGNTTRGLKLGANLGVGSLFPSGITVCPINFGITENFEMRFDLWLNTTKNTVGAAEIGGAGYGTAGTSAQVAGALPDSVFIGASTDIAGGATSADYRVYAPSHASGYQDADRTITGDYSSPSVFACSNRNNTATYYTSKFPATLAPQAQTNLFPRQTGAITAAGLLAFKWHDVSLKKVANTITYSIDGFLIATADARDTGTLGGTNILFTFYDINGTGSTDVDSTNLLFALFDNVRITNFANLVSVSATTPQASETGPTPAVFTLTRTSAGTPVTVNFTLGGTAINGVDYTNAAGSAVPTSVTFSALDTTTNITIIPVDDTIPEPTETVVLTIAPGTGYVGTGSDTAFIADNDTPTLSIAAFDSQMYERTNDYLRFRITRIGDLTPDLPTVNITYGGTAVAGRDFYGPATVDVPAAAATADFQVSPIYNGLVTGPLTITATVNPGTGYSVGTPATSGPGTIVDADDPPETVIWSDDFSTDTSGNWTVLFATTNDVAPDYCLNAQPDFATLPLIGTWPFDYSAMSIPPAPHTTDGSTRGLYLTVNKQDGTTAAAALNLYPKLQNFSGNYALRFDMFLIENDSSGTTEYALFGINHSGTKTNWFRNSTADFTGVDPVGWNFDGVFYDVESDGADLGQFVNYSSPTTANNNPTNLTPGVTAETMQPVFKSPPWTVGLIGGGTPANLNGSTTPIWADVELAQINGVIYWSINHSLIFAYTNTTGYTSGDIMLGYTDAYDSIGSSGGAVIYDNVRVIGFAPTITSIVPTGGGTYTINYTGGNTPKAVLVASPSVSAPLSGWSRIATNFTGSGTFSVSAAAPAFYRIKAE